MDINYIKLSRIKSIRSFSLGVGANVDEHLESVVQTELCCSRISSLQVNHKNIMCINLLFIPNRKDKNLIGFPFTYF